MRVKIEEKNSLPFVRYEFASGEHCALLDTGSDQTITYFSENDMDAGVTIVGLGGEKKSKACLDHIEFDLDDMNNDGSYETFDCDAVIVSKEFFNVFETNGIQDVGMVLGMNFFKKYHAKIDVKNKVLIVK